jgi:hypothetical protein
MSDNIGYTPGAGAIIAADNVDGALLQRVKLGVGGDGTAVDVSAENPMPVVPQGYDPIGQKLLVGTARDRLFDNFNTFDTTDMWELVQTGDGMTISGPLGGAVAGSTPYLNIASGVTANSKTILRSRQSFRPPFDLRYAVTASQRIANNQLRIGFLEVDDAGDLVTDTTYSTADVVLNARNAVIETFDGVTATSANLNVRGAGAALDTLANAFGTGFTTVATGTGPNFITPTIFALTMEREKINSRAFGQNVLTNTGTQFGYDRTMVNPTKLYKLYVIVDNGAVAPASTTDWRLHFVNLLDNARFDISPRNPGLTDVSKAMGVLVGNAVAIGTLPSIAATPILYADTIANLAGGATFNGTSRDGGAGAVYQDFFAMAFANVAGTLFVDNSTDNTAWVEAARLAVPAGESVILKVPAFTRYQRVRYVNGATAQASFAIRSMYRRI